MNRAIFRGGSLALAALCCLSTATYAGNIDTTGDWNGSSNIFPWGVPDTATYGETITATKTESNLKSITFYLQQSSGSAVNFQAFVYKWDETNSRITGSPLFSSGVMLSPTTGSSFVPVTVNTPGARLTAGQKYVVFFTTSSTTNPASGEYNWGSTSSSASYKAGEFVFSNNGNSFSSLLTSSWSVFSFFNDLAFIAVFGPNALSLANLNPNQTAIAQSVNAILDTATTPAMDGVTLALTNLTDQKSLATALDQLSPEVYNYNKIETLYSSQQFSNDLMSCRVTGDEGASIIREGQCLWVRGRARFMDLDKTANNLGATDMTGSFSAGGQVAVAPDWRLGFAAGYDTISLDSAFASSNGDRANIGGIVKYNPGPLLLAAGVTAGWGHFETDRTINFSGFSASPHSTNDIDYVSGQLHAAYLMQQTGWYAKPFIDAAITEIDLNGLTETKGGGAALHVAGNSDTVVNVSPGIELGTEMRFDQVSIWRPFVRAGVTWQDTDNFALGATFADAPAGTSPFVINTKFADVLADIGVGVDIINASGAVLRVQYDGRFGDDTKLNSVSLKGSVPF